MRGTRMGLAAWIAVAGCSGEAVEGAPVSQMNSDGSTADGGSDGEATTDPATSTTGSPPDDPVCGNGMREDGEACDDANVMPLDGCLSTCEAGPTGISFTPGQVLQYNGGSTGNRFDDACPAGEVLIGARGRADNIVRRLQLVCGALEVSEAEGILELTIPQATLMEERGTDDAAGFDLVCPENHVVIGFTGASDQRLDRLGFRCAPMTLVQVEGTWSLHIATETSVDTAVVGGEGGTPWGPDSCGDGEMAIEGAIRAGTDIVGLGLTCARVQLESG